MFGIKKEEKRVKKQIITSEELYRKLKAKLVMDDKSLSEWFKEQAQKEIDGQ